MNITKVRWLLTTHLNSDCLFLLQRCIAAVDFIRYDACIFRGIPLTCTVLVFIFQTSRKKCISVAYFIHSEPSKSSAILQRPLTKIPSAYTMKHLDSIDDLCLYVDKTQLTTDYGGTLQYNHVAWVDFQRVRNTNIDHKMILYRSYCGNKHQQIKTVLRWTKSTILESIDNIFPVSKFKVFGCLKRYYLSRSVSMKTRRMQGMVGNKCLLFFYSFVLQYMYFFNFLNLNFVIAGCH